LSQPFRDALVRARRFLWITDEAWRYREDERLDLLRASKTWIDLSHSDECPNHQPRDDSASGKELTATSSQQAP
jgi:hypothetical protein